MGRASSSSRIETASAEISAVSDISLTEYNEPDIPTQVFQAGHLNERCWRGSKFELRWAAGVPAGGGSRMEVRRARERYILIQFLIEAMVLSGLGGALGIAVGALLAREAP